MPPIPSSRALATPNFLSSIRATPHLPPNTWYYLASVTFALLNRPAEVPRIFTYALEAAIPNSQTAIYISRELEGSTAAGDDRESALTIFNKTREALLKASAIGGLPSTINAINSLKSASPPTLLDAPSPTSRASSLSLSQSEVLSHGDAFWDSVYGKVSGRVMGGMQRGYPDLGIVARVLYAHLLSEGSVLRHWETSLVLVAGLLAQGEEVAPQLKGHLRGAVNNGATAEQVKAARGVAMRICSEAGEALDEEKVPDL